MVRFFIVSSFFLTLAAHAHQLGTLCEQGLGGEDQERDHNFLHKLQTEADEKFPKEQFVRVASGKAIQPLADLMTLPTWPYLFSPKTMGGESIVVMLYAESPGIVLTTAARVKQYFAHHKTDLKQLRFYVYTSQMNMREMRVYLKGDEFTLRPIAHANNVRRLFSTNL